MIAKYGVSERLACRVLGQHRSTQRKIPKLPEDEAALTADIIALATQYGRYGYRRITALLREAGWLVNKKRVERIWRREGLKVPQKQPKKGRLWLNDGSCIRLRPEHPNHVWSYDFVEDRTHDGRKFRMLNVIDEFTRECLAIRVEPEAEGDRCDRRALGSVHPARRSGSHSLRQRPMWGSSSGTGPTDLSAPICWIGASVRLSQAASTVNGIVLSHSKHRIQRLALPWSSPSSIRDTPQVEDPNIIYRVAGAPSRPTQREVLPPGTGRSKKGRYSAPPLMTACTTRAILAVMAVRALRRRSASCRSRSV